MIATVVFYGLCALGMVAAVAVLIILAIEYGYRRGRREAQHEASHFSERMVRRFHEGRPL
ncbi:MAG: hypothetical protein EBR82_37225 [Caulobacteraceae bacterium]|nr:hypothetical protein [Caulobacteraceae bacterium]